MFHNFLVNRFSTLSGDGAYLIKSVPKDKLDALNDAPGTCNTVANPIEFASDGNQRPTRSDGGVWDANALDTMSEKLTE
jgi:hypothetical protein